MPGHIENNQTERNQDYEQYRKKFHHLIICRDCTRSFDAKEEKKVFGRTEGAPVTLCKFCGSDNIVIKGRHVFKYYCPACEKSYISEEQQTKCKVCGMQYLHMRRLNDLSKSDRLEVRKAKLKQLFKGLKMGKRHDKIGEKNQDKTGPKPEKESRNPSRWQIKKITDRKKKKQKKTFSLRSRRKDEELPTY
ncbi:MAG: hypothetical protein HY513_05270 [Candidatus Aenigmarchaeota archaeon]|nr:hypothetical protein [Candidatus Aenigmarchaeota archaeon]